MARGRHTTLLLLALLAPAADAAKKKDKAAKAAKPAAGAKAAGAAETLSAALARGDSLRQAGKYAEAEAAYRAASTLEPTRAEPHFFLGMTTRAADRTDEAMSHYKDALALSPQLAEAHMNVASLLSQMPGREQEALDHYSQALELREWPLELSAQAEYNSGICLYNLQRNDEARAALERAIAQAPTFEPARELLEQIDAEEAEDAADATSAADPPPPPSPPPREAWRTPPPPPPPPQAGAAAAAAAGGGERSCGAGEAGSTLEGTMAQLELQVMHELGQPAGGGAARAAQVSQLIASLSTLLARDLRAA